MAETVTARAANQHFSRLLREVAAGKSFSVLTSQALVPVCEGMTGLV